MAQDEERNHTTDDDDKNIGVSQFDEVWISAARCRTRQHVPARTTLRACSALWLDGCLRGRKMMSHILFNASSNHNMEQSPDWKRKIPSIVRQTPLLRRILSSHRQWLAPRRKRIVPLNILQSFHLIRRTLTFFCGGGFSGGASSLLGSSDFCN